MKSALENVIRAASTWADIDGVEFVAQGEKDGQDCIKVGVSGPEAARRIPQTFKGYPVIVEHTDKILVQEGGSARSKSKSR